MSWEDDYCISFTVVIKSVPPLNCRTCAWTDYNPHLPVFYFSGVKCFQWTCFTRDSRRKELWTRKLEWITESLYCSLAELWFVKQNYSFLHWKEQWEIDLPSSAIVCLRSNRLFKARNGLVNDICAHPNNWFVTVVFEGRTITRNPTIIHLVSARNSPQDAVQPHFSLCLLTRKTYLRFALFRSNSNGHKLLFFLSGCLRHVEEFSRAWA